MCSAVLIRSPPRRDLSHLRSVKSCLTQHPNVVVGGGGGAGAGGSGGGGCLLACLLACLTSQQHASVPQGQICSDSCTCCHTDIEVADHIFHITRTQYNDTRPTNINAEPVNARYLAGKLPEFQFSGHWCHSTWKTIQTKAGMEPNSVAV